MHYAIVHTGQGITPRRVRSQTHRVGRHAVVGIAERENILVARVQTCHQHREIVRLRARVDKAHGLEVTRKLGHQSLGIFVNLWMHIDVCCVPQLGSLLA